MYLRDMWVKRLLGPRVKVYTSMKPGVAGNIVMIDVAGIDPMKLWAYLWDKHRIMTTPIVHPEFDGLRITPSVYTMPDEVDVFCARMEQLLKSGLPA